jgi:hypothetical protein
MKTINLVTVKTEPQMLEEAYFRLKSKLEEVSSLPYDKRSAWTESFLKRKLSECQALLILTEVE